MDLEQLRDRMGEVGNGRVATLNDYELSFNKLSVHDEYGRANLVDSPSSKAEGVVFDLTDEQFTKMDRKEGKGYKRVDVLVQVDNDTHEAQTYIATAEFIVDGLQPSDEYLERIIGGAREHGLSEAYVAKIETLALSTKGLGVAGRILYHKGYEKAYDLDKDKNDSRLTDCLSLRRLMKASVFFVSYNPEETK